MHVSAGVLCSPPLLSHHNGLMKIIMSASPFFMHNVCLNMIRSPLLSHLLGSKLQPSVFVHKLAGYRFLFILHKMFHIQSESHISMFLINKSRDTKNRVKISKLSPNRAQCHSNIIDNRGQLALMPPVLKIYALMMLHGTFGKSSCSMASY